jgi:hypothetical protein
MKVGDKVRVVRAAANHWPAGLPTSGTVMALDGTGAQVEFLQGETHWIDKAVLEPEAMRANGGKPELSYALTFGEALREMAKVCTYGASKYDRGNYLKGAPLSQSVDCLLRHLLAWWEGEDKDPESGHMHLAHVVWNALRLCQESIARPSLDDRISYAQDRTAP